MADRWDRFRECLGRSIAVVGLYITPRAYRAQIKGYIAAGVWWERAQIEREALIGQSVNAQYRRGTTDGS